jgi:hypothetical protein
MIFEVRLPRVFHRGLERHHEHTLRAKPLGELIGGKGFSEAHLCVPQETWDRVHVFRPAREEVGVRYLHRFGLFMENVWWRVPVNRCPVRSSLSTVFMSLTEQRIHSSSVFANFFRTSAARTSWSLKMVPSSRSADSSSSIL